MRLIWLTTEVCDPSPVFQKGETATSALFQRDYAMCLKYCLRIKRIYNAEKSQGIKKGSISAKKMAEVCCIELACLFGMKESKKAH